MIESPAKPPGLPGVDAARGQRVSDLPLRLCRWGLVATVATSFGTRCAGPGAFGWRVRAGDATQVPVEFRLARGFLGTGRG